MSETLISLRQYHESVVADLGAHYGEKIATIAAYELFAERATQTRRAIATPAILLGIEEIDSADADEDGTDRQPLRLMCTADCILSDRTADLDLELRELTRDLLARVRHNRWGLRSAVRKPEALSAQPAEFAPEHPGYGAWRVIWEQLVYIGADTWAGTGDPPTDVYLGYPPFIGDGFEDHYDRIDR